MRLSDARRDKVSGIWEKIGLVLFLGGGGDMLFRATTLSRFLVDLLGIVAGVVFLVVSVIIIRK